MYACAHKDREMAAMLVGAPGAENALERKDRYGATALVHALQDADMSQRSEIVEILLRAGAEVDVDDLNEYLLEHDQKLTGAVLSQLREGSRIGRGLRRRIASDRQ